MLSIFRHYHNLFACESSELNIAQFKTSQLLVLQRTGQSVRGNTDYG